MGQGGDESKQPNAFLHRLLWPTSRRQSWCPDAYTRWPQLPSSGWHPPTSSWGYDRWHRGGIGWWWWDTAPKFNKLPDDKNRLPEVYTEPSKADRQPAAIPWSHPTPCSWSLFQFPAKRWCWWGCGLAMWAWSHCESSCCRLFGK